MSLRRDSNPHGREDSYLRTLGNKRLCLEPNNQVPTKPMPKTGPCIVFSMACLPLGSPLPNSVLLITTRALFIKWKPVYVTLLLQLCSWCVCMLSPSVMSDSLLPCGLQPARLLCPWNSPDKTIGVGSHSLFQGIFLTQGSNPGFLHCRQLFYHLSHRLDGPPRPSSPTPPCRHRLGSSHWYTCSTSIDVSHSSISRSVLVCSFVSFLH